METSQATYPEGRLLRRVTAVGLGIVAVGLVVAGGIESFTPPYDGSTLFAGGVVATVAAVAASKGMLEFNRRD